MYVPVYSLINSPTNHLRHVLSPRLFHFIFLFFYFLCSALFLFEHGLKVKINKFSTIFSHLRHIVPCAAADATLALTSTTLGSLLIFLHFLCPLLFRIASTVQGARTFPSRPLGGCLSVFLLWARPAHLPHRYYICF